MTGAVPSAIEDTIRENPADFYLANRGITLLAKDITYESHSQLVTITLGDPEVYGVADGGTTDAVIARVQREVANQLGVNFTALVHDQLPPHLLSSRVHLEVIVGLEDVERITRLVQGRNTSRQVKTWTIADFGRNFDWIKDVLEQPGGKYKGRIGYEENAEARVSVLEVLSILTLFHQQFDEGNRAPTVAYSGKGRMDKLMLSDARGPGYRALAPILEDILGLHDYVYGHLPDAHQKARPGGRLAAMGQRDDRLFPKQEKVLPLTDATVKYVVPTGILYPLLASLRALVKYDANGNASWKAEPRTFFNDHGDVLVDTLLGLLGNVGNNPQSFGKNKVSYTMLYNVAKMRLLESASAT